MNVDAASSAHISDRKDSGSFPAGCPKHVASIVPSTFAITNPSDPLNGIAPPSVATITLFVDLSRLYIVIGDVSKSICV